MTRTRRDSIVSSIASYGGGGDYHNVPQLLDDTYLFNQLQKLALAADNHYSYQIATKPESIGENAVLDKYDKYTMYLQQLDGNIEEYQTILAQSQDVSDQLTKAIGVFDSISVNTAEFVNKTKDLYSEYTELNAIHEKLPGIFQHFDALDPIMRRLNHSSSSNIVRKDSFKSMLTNLDASLLFFDRHADLRDSEKYRIKFKRCLIRACELISHYLRNLLTHTYTDIEAKLSGDLKIRSQVSREPLLYNKFALAAEEFYPQVIEITSRASKKEYERYYDELSSILNGCYDHYFQTRSKLLQPITSSLIKEIVANGDQQPLVKFIQKGKSAYQQLCIDEYKLFVNFFPKDNSYQRVNQWLCKLCEPLYDCMRTRILRETDISMLCDSVTLFSQYYQFEENSEEYSKQFHDITFDKIFEPIVQKLQARLILRVQIYIQENIVKYAPSKDSFIISRRKKGGAQDTNRDIDSIDTKEISEETNTNLWTGDMDSCYPTLRRALWLLSKIYEMVNSVVFDDLAHHIVHDCIFSLRKAYDMMQSLSSGVNNLDVKLAYMKNLLMLRQEIQNFNIQYTVNETYLDFSGVETFFKSVKDRTREQRGQVNTSVFGVAKSLLPRVVNSMVDARSELMVELRNIIKDFTDSVGKDIIEDTLELEEPASGNLMEKNVKLRTNIEKKLPHIHAQICNFIDDNEIVMHLVDAIQETVIDAYNHYYDEISKKAESGSLDKVQVSELMFDDVFADFVNKVTNKLTTVPESVV